MTAAETWAEKLEAWALPAEILDQAPESPYQYPKELFAFRDEQARIDAAASDDPSTVRARDAVPAGGSVLDVGAGAARAALALVPPAGRLVLVDQHAGLLADGRAHGEQAGAGVDVHVGQWPAIADTVPSADVVVCHHVLYNIADIGPFVAALDARATRRVVVELTDRHPWAPSAPLFRRFWDLDRPDGPSADEAIAAITETTGITPVVERHERPSPELPHALSVLLARRRLCLTADHDPDIATALAEHPMPTTRRLVTAWWDR